MPVSFKNAQQLAYSKNAVDNGAPIWCRQCGICQNHGIDRIEDVLTPADFHSHASLSGRCEVVNWSSVHCLADACLMFCIAVHDVLSIVVCLCLIGRAKSSDFPARPGCYLLQAYHICLAAAGLLTLPHTQILCSCIDTPECFLNSTPPLNACAAACGCRHSTARSLQCIGQHAMDSACGGDLRGPMTPYEPGRNAASCLPAGRAGMRAVEPSGPSSISSCR